MNLPSPLSSLWSRTRISRFPRLRSGVWLAGLLLLGVQWVPGPAAYGFDSYEKFQESKQAPPPVTLEALPGRDRVRPGESFWLYLVADLNEGWHLYSLEIQPGEESVATQIELKATDFPPEGEWQETPPRLAQDDVLEKIMKIHSGRVEFSRLLKVPEQLPPGSYPLSGALRFRTCDNRVCTLPQTLEFQTRVIVEAGGIRP